jgi:predicted AAA+ superfamily ATPase
MKYPVIAVTGPRQSGKTTLLKSVFPDYEYVSLENPDIRNFAENDANGFLKRYAGKVIFDEVQRVPALFSYIQTKVDESGEMGQFILSGSQNFHLMENITQSLAGRVAIFKLFPFDFQELQAVGLLPDDYIQILVKGFYPAIYDRDIPSRIFYSNYVETYVQRDVSELIAIKDIRLFQNFLGLCATRAGQLLNLNSLANECGISQPTAKSWLSALENSYIVFQLFPYHENFGKRIIKTPKLYFYDSGLLCYLLKISSVDQILTHPVKGNLFENMMIAEYVKRIHHNYRFQDVWFWRDSTGNEVDLLVQDGQNINIFEIKAGQTIMSDMFKGLNWWEDLSGKKGLRKTLIYGGNENHERSMGNVLSWREFGK